MEFGDSEWTGGRVWFALWAAVLMLGLLMVVDVDIAI